MKILLENQEFSPVSSGGRSFFHYTVNNDSVFQQYLNLDLFEKQMGAGKGKGLVIYEHPARIVAGAILDGAYDNAPLQKWINEAEKSLAVIRQYRRSILVVERDATDEQYFKSAFSAAFSGRQPPQDLTLHSQQDQGLTLLIALLAVRQLGPVAQLINELEASSVAPANEMRFDDVLRFAAKEIRELSGRAGELEIVSKAQLDKLQAADAHIKQLQAKHQSLTQEYEALRKATQGQEPESNEILMRQVLDLESSLRQADYARRKAEERAADAEQKHQTATKEVVALKMAINLIRNSTSWRLTAPIRAIKGAFSR